MEKVEAAIREFHARMVEMERVLDAMNSVMSMAPESDLQSAIWALVESYQASLSAAYNIGDWLEWWWLECKLGAVTMTAGLPGEAMRKISNIDDLVKLIIDDLKQSEKGE